MTVLVKKSVCVDCIWINSCNSFRKIDDMCDRRDNPGHTNTVFEVIIHQCSTKNCDRSYKTDEDNKGLYYCAECNSMHRENSRIGKLHRKAH